HAALSRDIPVIPVLVGQARMPGEQALPELLRALAYRNAAEVRSGRDFRDHVDRLIRGIEFLLSRGQKAAEREALDLGNDVTIQFTWVPPGTYSMGGGGGKPGDKQIEIAEGFALGIYQVTQEQWQAVMGNNPSYFSRNGHGKDAVKNIADADLRQF